MINTSEAWKAKHLEPLLPETFVEITCGLEDVDAASAAEPTGANESVISNTDYIVQDRSTSVQYATLEHNLWVLDGSKLVLPDSDPYSTPGYISDTDVDAAVTISFAEPRAKSIPGITIVWSRDYNDYPTEFSVVAKNGDTEVASTTVTGNGSVESAVALDLVDYDSITITPLTWCLPERRCRLDSVAFGLSVTYKKDSIISYTHEQTGSLNSAELPKNSIRFSLDNVDGRWNPRNPMGMGKYLSERQTVEVRYGMNVDGVTEWLNAGTFYLSEWRAPSNGLEAHFVARDVFEFLLNKPYTGITSGTLRELVTASLTSVELPEGFTYMLDDCLANYTGTIEDEYTAAEVIQMCANAAKCVIWQDHSGVLHVEPLPLSYADYTITGDVSYAHPELELSKPLKAVSVNYGDNLTHILTTDTAGETQTVMNTLIGTEEQATAIAAWVYNTLVSRKSVTGSFRGDPRLELYDIVVVESKYGDISPVVITAIEYAYAGAFRAEYTGRVIADAVAAYEGV